MKETRYTPDPKQPYSLHDSRISGMELSGRILTLTFENGFTKIGGPDVQGSIAAEGVDPDFCMVILQGSGGRTGSFCGEKLSIAAFTEKYKGFSFEVIEEYYGWHRLQFTGWLWMPDAAPKDMTLSLGYFSGDIVYRTEE